MIRIDVIRLAGDAGLTAQQVQALMGPLERLVDLSQAAEREALLKMAGTAPGAPEPLTVRVVSFAETNGKRNWTAMFVRTKPWGGLVGNAGGITIARGELWNRVAYAAERARCLLGERDTDPDILAYGDDVSTPEEWKGTDPESLAAQAKGTACDHIYHAHHPLPHGQATAKCSKCGHEPRVLGGYQTDEIAPMAHDKKDQTT